MAKGPCVFCGIYAGGTGEHVLPQWLLELRQEQGPFTILSNGHPIAKRSGVTERMNQSRVTLPVCGRNNPSSDCNGWLNKTFEHPAKPHVRGIFDDLRPVTGVGVELVARWAVKTLLLYRHPKALDSELQNRPRRSWELPSDLLPTMRRIGQLPDDLSLWVAVVDPDAPSTHVPPFEAIWLPRVTRDNGVGGTGASTMLGFGLFNGSKARLVFQLVFHPLVDFEHPLETAGLVTKLWPPPPQLDLRALPALDAAAEKQWGRVFASAGIISIGLPPGERWSHDTMTRYDA